MMDIICVVSIFEHNTKLILSFFFSRFACDLIEKQILLFQHEGRIHKSYLIHLLKCQTHTKPLGYEENTISGLVCFVPAILYILLKLQSLYNLLLQSEAQY